MTVAARDRRPTRPAASAAYSTLPSTQPAASQAIVLAVIAAGALATIALWWNDTTAIHGIGDWRNVNPAEYPYLVSFRNRGRDITCQKGGLIAGINLGPQVWPCIGEGNIWH